MLLSDADARGTQRATTRREPSPRRARARGEPSRAKRAPTRTSFVSGEGRSAGRCARKRESAATPLVALVRCHEAARDFSSIDHTRPLTDTHFGNGFVERPSSRACPALSERAKMTSHSLGGVTVDAVREQLKQLGHEDVSDSVISEFLSQLSVDASRFATPSAPAEAAAGPSASTGPDEDAEPPPRSRDESRGPPRRRRGRAPPPASAVATSPPPRPPPPLWPRPVPSTFADAFPPSLASRTHASARASRRLGRRYPKVDVSNPRGSVAASPPSSSSAAHRTPRGSRSANPSARAHSPPRRPNSSAGPRFAYSRSTPDLEPSRRASPGELRRVAPSAPAAPNRSGGSVIRAPVHVRGCTPGQAYRIDRVARNRAYQEAWNRDAFLSSKENRGAIGRGPTATAAVVPRQSENVKAAVAAAREMNRRNVEAARGQSRTQTKLTSSFGRVGDGVGRGRGSAAFATPDSKRRDDVRWEIRRMMAEPPTF